MMKGKMISLVNLCRYTPKPKSCHQWRKSLHYDHDHAPPSPLSSISSYFNLSRMCRDVNHLKSFHVFLIVHGYANDVPSPLIRFYGDIGLVSHARSIFDHLPTTDFDSFNDMLNSYSQNNMDCHVISFYNLMRATLGLFYDDMIFYKVLKACYEVRDVVQASKLHCHFLKAKLPQSFVLRSLVDVYYKCGCVVSAWHLFDEITERNVLCWTSMVVSYVQNGSALRGLALFIKMREGFVYGNEFIIGSLVKACTNLRFFHQGKSVHGYVIKNGIEFNSFLLTSLLDMYVKCGHIEDARSVFDEFSTGDIVSWTAMIEGYTQRGYPHMALELFTDEKWAGVLPNSIILASLLSACAQLGNAIMGKSLHVVVVKCGLDDLSVMNALVDMYAKCCITLDGSYEKNVGIAP